MRNHPLIQLTVVRIKEFIRVPEAVFWAYGFPLLMVIGLGIAFRNKPDAAVVFDIVRAVNSAQVTTALEDDERFDATERDRDEALARLYRNKTPIVVEVNDDGSHEYHFDPTNPDGRSARAAINDALQQAAGRHDPVNTHDTKISAPGSRYIDFLVPGLIGMNLMGGGVWGVGFVVVDMRVRNLLKRMLATPMRRQHFLLSVIGLRALFFIPEMTILLLAAYLIFKVPMRGSFFSVILIGLIGSLSFAGLGLLVACRAKRIETVSGLMNLVMLPMWLMSGIFFSSERFPNYLQPLVKALPLTQLNDALRAVILDGDGLGAQAIPLLILLAWGGVSFAVALKWFRWSQ